MNTQKRGHCPCCGREQAVMQFGMSKHGYTVKYGWFQGICDGEGRNPIETDRSHADRVVKSVLEEVAALREKAANLLNGSVLPDGMKKDKRVDGKWQYVLVPYAELDDYDKGRAAKIAASEAENRASVGEAFAQDLSQIIEKYHGQPLIVVEAKPATKMISAGDRKLSATGKLLIADYQHGARVYYNKGGWIGTQAWRKLRDVEGD